MHLAKLVSRPPVTLGPDATIVEAAQAMREKHVGAVVAVDEERHPLGILTDRDIVVSIIAQDAKDLLRLSLRDVCNLAPIVAREDEDLEEAVMRMRRHGIRRVPVVDRHGRLTGVFSLDDALGSVAAELADVAGLLRAELIREETRRVTPKKSQRR